MLVRTWRTEIDPERRAEYRSFAERRSLPMFQRADGCQGVIFGEAGDQAVVVTLWRDLEALEAFEASQLYADTVNAIEAGGFLRGRHQAEVYEAHGSWVADS